MMAWWWCAALLASLALAEPRYPGGAGGGGGSGGSGGGLSQPAWQRQRGARTLDERRPRQFVGPHVCGGRNNTHCCPGWTSRPNSLRCVIPICRPDCGAPGACVAPNMCRCPGGHEAPSCAAPGGAPYPYPTRTAGGCARICMNGGSCGNGTCACAPGWQGDYCTDPICREPCLHGGKCIAPDRCVCFHGLSGTRCEIDRRTGPCYTETRGALCTGALEGVVCTQQLCCATVGVAWGHPCERCADLDCEPGHLRNLATKECQDIDECAAVPGLCSGGKCVNSPGSFSCECPAGQRRHPVSNNCEDIDECEDPDICPNGKCINTEGDYYCLCNPHFIPSPDKKFCIDGRVGNCFTYLSETGECSDRLPMPLSNRDCCCGYNMGRAWGDLCAPCPPRGSAEWTHLCGGNIVPPDWRRNQTSGGHEWGGGGGGAGGGGGTGDGSGGGSGGGGGYDGNGGRERPAQQAKINECMLRNGICGLGTCIDKDVGYQCECWEGAEATQQDGNPTCIDIDECALGYCRGGACLNKPGAFECRCPAGFDPVEGGRRCSDKNECETTHGGMCTNGVCTNIDGGFECSCNPGYEPTQTGHACRDVDECRDNLRVCRRGRCRNTAGSYECACEAGFAPTAGGYCADVDECADISVCMVSYRCRNTAGSYECACEAGFAPTAGGYCADVDECADISVCMVSYRCRNTAGSYECACEAGFAPTAGGYCADVDECADISVCMVSYRCRNTAGSYECACEAGFAPTAGGYCADVDECADISVCMVSYRCRNTAGSYECACEAGFAPTAGGYCADVDECADISVCMVSYRCRNTAGSYECACEAGFAPTAGGYCADVDECADISVCMVSYRCGEQGRIYFNIRGGEVMSWSRQEKLGKGGRCVNGEGSFQCVCEAGYRPTPDRGACVDVDECSELKVCRNGLCHNTAGSFRCDCRPGFTLSADGRTCLDEVQDLCYEKYEEGQCRSPGSTPITRSQCCCSATKGLTLGWGVSCKACPAKGSEEFNILCPEGASKDNSGKDINECNMIPGVCAHGACENLEPGYRCICDPGFHPDADGVCRDIDECDMYQSYCTGGQCRNTVGSFTCVCPAGTRYEPAEQLCRDIDECDELSNPCDNGRCINTHGGYECECEPGFVLDASARHCLDNRRGSCWRRVVDGHCEGAAPRTLLRQECCCSVGLAWGSPCEPCDTEHCPCPKGFAKLDGATCRDVDECMLDSELCVGGTCVNTDGSYRCECPPGLNLDSTGNRCVDHRREYCYTEYVGGRCSHPMQVEVLKAVCCCSSLGRAWGDGRCESCPKRGTDAYRALCISEVEGPGTHMWERPGGGPGFNTTSIWAQGGGGAGGSGDGGFGSNLGGGGDGWGGGGGDNWGQPGGLLPGQVEVNECSSFPGLCGHGRCRNLPGTFTCDCFPGYEKDSSNHTCVDVDECEIVADVCKFGTCHNTAGGFTCHCHPGYRTDDLSKVCVDIDECSETAGLCRGGRCVNTAGSFRCACAAGMELAPDRLACKDIDECSTTSGICSNGACENLMGTYQCVCDEGYAQSSVKSHCEDIDECSEDPTRCEHDCINTPGSYHCTCKEGWHLRADGRSCRDVDECAHGARPCGGGECRNTPGSYRCACGEGLLPSPAGSKPTCQDVDECSEIAELCGAGECRNTIGSFVCRCPDGYSVKPEQGPACTDDDECELGTCDCHPAADCINLPGSFQCRCRDGWRGDGSECEDVDECVTNNGGCHPRATCSNTDGSFACLCDTGYKGDGYSCVDIDECENDPTLCENGRCTNTPGGYECDCDIGFTKSPDGRACLDLDECSTFDNVCVFGRCENTYGMFKCICDNGYQPDSIDDDLMPGFNCTDIDECQSPQSCQYGQCVNTPGSYVCRCPPNYDLVSDGTACFDPRRARCYGKVEMRSGGDHCRDSDELSEDGTMAACCCSVGAAWGNYCDRCPDPESEEYRQLCPGGPGYQPVLEAPSYVVTLADIDECAQHPALCEHGTCTNTFGSYVCTCGAGWRLSGDEQRCEDVDECARADACGPGVCRNLPGSYVCLCPEGYVPMPSGKECVDVRQRQCYMEWDDATGRCSSAVGVPQTKYLCCCSVGRAWGAPCESCPDKSSAEHTALCGEKPGEYINPMTNETKPIDECSIMPQLCKPGTCHDTSTGFQCACDHGYEHDNTSHVCRDIDECAGGGRAPPCRGLAQCANLPGAYECRCPPGYRRAATQDQCEDKDECEDDNLCEHGSCRNTIGSYRCECAPGYTLRDNVCRDVDECNRPRPLCWNGTCENLPGSYVCHCDDGFKPGANNDCIDINECREGIGGMVCRNGRCRNTLGSFRCECAVGYALSGDGRNCRDIDECSEIPHPCGRDGTPSCTNTNGGYECSCGLGWRLVGRRCVDRDECREQQDVCAGGECHNVNGGYRCECPQDWRFDKEAAICVDERKELCYDGFESGRCHNARSLKLGRSECCCTDGAAWGRYCEICPPRDSPEFLRICQGGMGRQNLTQDLDECVIRPDVCNGGHCINTDGSFRCECQPGYILDSTGLRCVDDDECLRDPRICGNGSCTNTPGGYECRCNHGFTQGLEQTCVDIDECAEGRALCAFRCHNTLGSFRCTCPYGYAAAADGVHCRDVDECAAAEPVCAHACENVVGSFICKCPDGYRRTSAAHDAPDACEDVDECAEQPDRCAPGVCVNTDGGYSCDCDVGYQPSEDGHTCVDHRKGMCYRSLVTGRCAPEPWPRYPLSTPASPTHITKAKCCCTIGAAWGPECEICPAPGTTQRMDLCSPENIAGGGGGGGGDGGGGAGGSGLGGGGGGVGGGGIGGGFDVFGDIDECATIPGLCAPGRCVNTVGSFRCVCGRGFRAAGDVCADVDECAARPAPCQQLCKNTDGSYECLCRAGYEVDEDGADCRDVDECERGTHTCQQTCTNTDGSYECSCQEGYEKRGDACVDINECLEEGICPPPGKCVNLLGSHRCVCPRGFRLDATGSVCVDRDECEDGRCQSPCRNYAGGYRCDCPAGTTRASNGVCVRADACASEPCGASPCFSVGGAHRCGCPGGYGWNAGHGVCVQMAGGCASASCLFGCSPLGDSYQCGCPAGYSLVGAGHCVTTLDGALPPDDIGDAPVFPVRDQFRTGGKNDLISTEGCFSCKMNGRHRRAPDEGIVFANGTTLLRKRRRRSRRGRRSLMEPEAELLVVSARPRQTWGRAPLLRLLPAEGGARPHYRISYGDDNKDFLLNKRDGAWALRLRRHLKSTTTLDRQLELEARFVAPGGKRLRRHVDVNVPAPLRLYVSVRIAPAKR